MPKQTKTQKIEGTGTVIDIGSSCVGCMAWETPYAIIGINGGERYRYQSDRVDILGLSKDDLIKVSMLVRDDKVWRFKLIEKYDI